MHRMVKVPLLKIAWPRTPRSAIVPLFMPFSGCPTRCLFCSQEAQTGHGSAWEDARLQMNRLQQSLRNGDQPVELAFYGGTFTGLPRDRLKECLEFANRLLNQGVITGFRCSTRPDFITAEVLEELCQAGCHLIELGVQSFSARALQQSRRGYTPGQIWEAARLIREAGLALGIQLLPGLPGSDREDFLRDVQHALLCQAHVLRFYPCLVLKDTGLARQWRAGQYEPWTLSQTLNQLAQGWNLARTQEVPVIRMGLAPEKNLEVLAGPVHPALGSRVLGLALYLFVRERLQRSTPFSLALPRHCQGHFWGWQRELENSWLELGLRRVTFHSADELALDF